MSSEKVPVASDVPVASVPLLDLMTAFFGRVLNRLLPEAKRRLQKQLLTDSSLPSRSEY
jgi:hypothetical protein